MALTTTTKTVTSTIWTEIAAGPGAFITQLAFDNSPADDNTVVLVSIAPIIPAPEVAVGFRLDFFGREFAVGGVGTWTSTDKAWARSVSGTAKLVVTA